MPKKEDPTPWLGQINSKSQIFSHGENKLLDQLTLEVTEAWKKDLLVMRSCYKNIIENSQQLKNITNLMEKKFPELQKFINSHPFLDEMPELLESIKHEIGKMKGELLHEITRVDQDIKNIKVPKEIMSISVNIARLFQEIECIKKIVIKPWWKKIFS